MGGFTFTVQGAGSGNLAEVDDDGRISINVPTEADKAGFVKIVDSQGSAIITTENGALTVSQDSLGFIDQVDGSALNTNKWNTAISGMTVTQANGFINLNGGGAVTANAYAILTSNKYFPLYAHLPFKLSFNLKANIQPQANATIEFGLGLVGTNAAPTDGAFFRFNASAQTQAVISNGGSETATTLNGTYTSPDGSTSTVPCPINQTFLYEMVIVEDLVQFLIDDVVVAEVLVPAGLAYPTNAGRLPLFARVYNGGSVPSVAPILSIGQVVAVQEGMSQADSLGEALVSIGQGLKQSPVTPFTQTENWPSGAPTTRTLANATPCETTLGGLIRFTPTMVADTDYPLFGFQVPTGYQACITKVWYTPPMLFSGVSAITTNLVQFAVGLNCSAASLATVDGAGTWAPRHMALGVVNDVLSMTTASLPGALGSTSFSFDPPLICDSGRFVHFIMRALLARTAGASEVHHMSVGFHGYFK